MLGDARILSAPAARRTGGRQTAGRISFAPGDLVGSASEAIALVWVACERVVEYPNGGWLRIFTPVQEESARAWSFGPPLSPASDGVTPAVRLDSFSI
jgi:hypothetical protein